jgi:hypothetical protein
MIRRLPTAAYAQSVPNENKKSDKKEDPQRWFAAGRHARQTISQFTRFFLHFKGKWNLTVVSISPAQIRVCF